MGHERFEIRRLHWPQRGAARVRAVAIVGAAVLMVGAGIIIPLRVAASDSVVNKLALELDGNIATDSATQPPYDWDKLFTPNCPSPGTPGTGCPNGATANSVSPFFGSDFKADWTMNSDGTYNSGDSSVYATGSKDTLGVGNGGWQCKNANNVGNKVDITNFYVTAQVDPSNNHLIADFGMEKFGSNGTNDIGVWFLGDSSADCSSANGTSNFGGHHSDGDVLLTAEFTSGGGTSNVEAFKWVCETSGNTPLTGLACDTNGALVTGPKVGNVVTGLVNGSACVAPSSGTNTTLCAITNTGDLTNVPWLTASAAGVGHTVPAVQFYEGSIDLTAISGGNACEARAIGDTRSSATPDATLFDFASEPFAACGGMSVHKYIDVNGDGSDSLPGTPDLNGAGWNFTVKNSGGTVVCSGTTDANGNLVCSTGALTGLQMGTYTVTETQKTGFYNTDPGNTASGAAFPHINTGKSGETPNPLTKQVTITPGGIVPVDFGNDCFRSFSPTVNNLTAPTGQTVKVDWSVNSGSYDAGSTGTLTLTPSGSTWSGTTGAVFTRGDTVTWKYYLSGDSTNKVTANSSLSMASGTYPNCNVPDSSSFGPPTAEGFKFKDNPPLGGDGTTPGKPGTEDTAIGGFTFDLYAGTGTGGALLATTTSASGTGLFTFTGLQPGTYTIHEDLSGTPGWKQTYPVNSSGGAIDKTFTVSLADNSTGTTVVINEGNWLDTPLSHFSITVTPEATLPGTTPPTPATHAGTMTCTLSGQSQSGNTYSSGNGLTEGTYTCTVPIVDP